MFSIIVKLIACVSIGVISWSGDLRFFPLTFLIPVLWVHSGNRWQGALLVVGYYLAASRGLPAGTATYFNSWIATGVLVWLAAACIQGVVWLLLWRPARTTRALMVPVILIVLSVPPFGIVGWGSPLTAAGVVFPGLGFLGLLLSLAALTVLSLVRIRHIPACMAVLLVPVLALSSAPGSPDRWSGIDTHQPFLTGERDFLADYQRQLDLIDIVQSVDADVVILPESAAGRWNDSARLLWQQNIENRSVLIGAEVLSPGGLFENVIVGIDAQGDKILYRQRMPVPVSMWLPWGGSTAAYWFENPFFDYGGLRVAPLICYEQHLIWPVVHSMIYRPDVLLAVGNVWWGKGTSLPANQKASATAWARLFSVQLVTSYNF